MGVWKVNRDELYKLFAAGVPTAELAQRYGVSLTTISNHRSAWKKMYATESVTGYGMDPKGAIDMCLNCKEARCNGECAKILKKRREVR